MHLIHPIYLDVPMLVSFAAAIQGGLSLESEVTREKGASKGAALEATTSFGLSQWFSNLIDATAGVSVSGTASGTSQETRREMKSHTESSVAILLYDELRKNSDYLVLPRDADGLTKIKPGALVEIAGTLEKNAIDAVIDYIDAANILSSFGSQPQIVPPQNKPGQRRRDTKPERKSSNTELGALRDVLDKDRKRTPISNAILRCSEPQGITVVITLRTANLRDLTLAELHKNNVRVVGKVTRIIEDGQSMSAFENYGMSLVKPEILDGLFSAMTESDDIVAEFSEVQIKGPAVQLLPLMIFV